MLISQNSELINNAKNQLLSAQNCFDAIYKSFLAIDIEVSIADIFLLLGKEVNKPATNDIPQGLRALMKSQPDTSTIEMPNYLIDFVKNKIVSSMSDEPTIGGIKLTKEALKEMIELPNVEGVAELLPRLRNLELTNIRDKFLFWLKIEDGSVIEEPTASDQIEQRFSVFVTTSNGIAKANQYKALCDALNEAQTNKIELGKLTEYGSSQAKIEGILYEFGKGFFLDGYFIKSRFDK